ncbi:MAG TPA: protein-glutamate O-methyltransferase CheR [Chthonomonadales bacterium]|nr:protein-glutamate O-methyltransferase CheR [Chthonomonadales bacterium]
MQEQATLSGSERADYEAFKQKVRGKCGVDLSLYKEQQMHRRLRAMAERARAASFCEYFALLDRDASEWARFLDRMTINVSELFRNPEKWEELRSLTLPVLLQRRKVLRVWSAGCSFGAEPYSLAMLLDDVAPGARHYLLATDIDAPILERAREGVFTEADVANVPAAYRRKWLQPHAGGLQVAQALRERVTFRRHNLLADPFEKDFDLIVCRNVVIYFTEEAKGRLYTRFRDALAQGGSVFVGGTERIFNAEGLGLQSRAPFFYTRVA